MNLTPKSIIIRIKEQAGLIDIIKNISWLFFDKILRMGVGIFVTVWIARYLGPELFGQLNFVTAFVGIFSVVGALGLQAIVVREVVKNPNDAQEIIGTSALLQIFSGFMAYGGCIFAMFWIREDDLFAKQLILVVGSIILFKSSDFIVYFFEAKVLSKYTVLAQCSSFIIFSFLKIALIVSGAPLVAFAWAIAGEACLTMILLFLIFERRGHAINTLRFNLTRAKNLFLDSWPLFLSGITIMIYMKIDQIMLGEISGDKSVGIYSAALRISEVFYFIPMIILSTITPYLLEKRKINLKLFENKLQLTYDAMVIISLCFIIPMTFISGNVVNAIYGANFSEAGPILAIHIWTSLFVFLGVASGQWFVAENRQILSLQRAAMGAVMNVILNYFTIPMYGGIGAAFSTLIAQLFSCLLFDLLQKDTRPMFIMKLKSFNVFRHISNLRLINEKL